MNRPTNVVDERKATDDIKRGIQVTAVIFGVVMTVFVLAASAIIVTSYRHTHQTKSVPYFVAKLC